MKKKLIKIYGERNTNTRYFSKLIELNLNAKQLIGVSPRIVMKMQRTLPGNEFVRDLYFNLTFRNNLGWKHSLVKAEAELGKYRIVKRNLIFITITKNPYSWLLSLHKRPYHQYYTEFIDFEHFLQTPWKTIAREHVDGSVENPIELWNIKNRSYLQLDRTITMNIRTEDIFANSENVIEKISQQFFIPRKSREFIEYKRSTKNEDKDSDYYRNYYLSEKWREKLSSKAIRIINKSIDKDLMDYFGYSLFHE